MHNIALAADLQLLQFLRLPSQDLVRHAPECLAQHNETTCCRVACTQMQIRQPGMTAAGCFPRRQYGNGNRDDIPREHDGATHAGHSDPCRGGNGVDEKTLLCALTKVTVYKGCQPLAFSAGAAGEQFG